MTRIEIRRRALRAAATVSLTTLSIGFLGCETTVETAEDGSADPPAPSTTATAAPTTPPSADPGKIPPIMAADAGADAPDCTCPPDEDWATCCEKVNWSFECGCEAWGPPVPPAMEVA